MLAAALLLSFPAPIAADLDRDELVADLRYGVSLRFAFHLTLAEVDDRPRNAWLDELIDSNIRAEDDPVAALRRAREAANARDEELFRAEIRSAIGGLRKQLAEQGEAASNDLRLLLGFGYSLAFWGGGPASILEQADELLRDAYRRDPSRWHALVVLADMYGSAATRTGPDQRHVPLERGIEVLELALADHPDEDRLRSTLAGMRFTLWGCGRCDPREPECLADLLGVWRDWRDAIEDERMAAANRAVAACLVVGLLAAPRLDPEVGELPDELAAIRPTVLADLAGVLDVDVFAGRAAAMIWLLHADELGTEDERVSFEQALDLYDDADLLRSMRLLAALRRGDCEHGLPAAEAAIARGADDRTLILAANLRLDCGTPAEAEALLRDRWEEDSAPAIAVGLGVLLLRAERDEDALSVLREAVAEDSSSPIAAWALGTALALSGELASGLEQLERARALLTEPNDSLEAAIDQVERALADEEDA